MTVLLANESPIKSVKLFRDSGAEVTRVFPLSSLLSHTEPQVVEIINLPGSLDRLSASVTCTAGDVTILDYHSNSQWPAPTADDLTSVALHDFKAELLRLQDERRLRQQSFKFLSTYMDSLAQGKTQAALEASQMVTYFDDFIEIGKSRSVVIAQLEMQIKDVEQKIKEETERLSKQAADLPSKVVVTLRSRADSVVENVQLVITYMVTSVTWKPIYDLRVIATGDLPSASVSLDFRCDITQRTGENWDNVELMLTTGSPASQLIRLPEPQTIEIGLGMAFRPPVSIFGQRSAAQTNGVFFSNPELSPSHPDGHYRPQDSTAQGGFSAGDADTHSYSVFGPSRPSVLAPAPVPPASGLFGAALPQSATEHGSSLAVASGPLPLVIPPPQGEFSRERERDRERDAVVYARTAPPPVSQLISQGTKDPITHIAQGTIFVPSDGSAHHVLVVSIPLKASFMRVAVPSIDTRVYYTCEVENTSEYILLPGTLTTYLNDKQVSVSEIRNTEKPQTLECSLGVDTGVTTINNRSPDSLPSFGTFTGKVTTTYTNATFINNTHADTLRGVVIRSSLPLPADPRVTIVLKEPAGLADIDTGNVNVREGCQARWSTTGERKGKQAGLFEWVCDVKPGTEVLKAVWEVCAPQGLNLVEQVRPTMIAKR